MKRRKFLFNTALVGGFTMIHPFSLTSGNFFDLEDFPIVRVKKDKRNFTSPVIEQAIDEFAQNVQDKELSWLFNNCFPNTLDTTVTYSEKNGRPDTYVITGDIDAMWL